MWFEGGDPMDNPTESDGDDVLIPLGNCFFNYSSSVELEFSTNLIILECV